ncbi:MAG: hypothetical protein ACTSRG_15930 [Candidatus Helarchaeota archaeon]
MSKVEVIKAIFIFEKKSGRPFIRYMPSRDFKIEPFLVIGFLTAIMKFSKEVGRSDLKMIDMENLRFVFTEKDDIIFNAITTKLVKPLDLMFKLNTIATIFLNQYTKEELTNPKVALEFYDTFLETIDEIIHGEVRGLETSKEKKIRKLLQEFNKDNGVSGSGVLSFTGDFLVNSFSNDEEVDIVFTIFNSIFETKIFGINKFYINIENRDIFIRRLDEETLFAVISNKDVDDLHAGISEIMPKIKQIIKS